MQNLLYGLYSKVLERNLSKEDMPKHIGVMVDGNRRWAKVQGFEAAGQGHAAGAKKIIEFLSWCSDLGVKHVTLYLLSTDNLKGRTSQELTELVDIIVSMSEELADIGRWKLQMVGDKEALPAAALGRMALVEKATSKNSGTHVNLAIAYGGRKEIADAMRDILRKHSKDGSTVDQLAEGCSSQAFCRSALEPVAQLIYSKQKWDQPRVNWCLLPGSLSHIAAH